MGIEEVIIYHGSLQELNSRDQNKQYEFVKEESFISGVYDKMDEGIIYRHKIAREISTKGYDGLVNSRTIIFSEEETCDLRFLYIIEGTPIKRKM